jgi:hypothetical protein
MKKNDTHAVQDFSAVQMKRELQDQFQRKTAGMNFAELRRFLDETLEPLPQEKCTEDRNAHGRVARP